MNAIPVRGIFLMAATIALMLCACGGEKQMHAQAAPPPQAPALGVTNAQPATPNSVTATNVVISEDVLRACNIPDANAYFAFDSSRLESFDDNPLSAVATCFASGPMRARKLHLVGHADPRGASDYNMALGQSRADSVAAFLFAHGLRPASATTTSRGAMDATGHDETGWAHDRRVEVLLAH